MPLASKTVSPQAAQPAIEIRPARPEDAALIADMVHALADAQGVGSRASVNAMGLKRDLFAERPLAEALIAERGGVPSGMALFQTIYSTWDGALALVITDLFVDEALRGTGVGQRLVRTVAALAKSRGCTSLQVNVVHANRNAAFFDQMGFRHQDDLLNYRLDGKGLSKLAGPAG